MKEGRPATIHIPYFGMCPQQCKTNQQATMAKLKAKRAFRDNQIPIPSFPSMLKMLWTHGWQQRRIWVPQMVSSTCNFKNDSEGLTTPASCQRSERNSTMEWQQSNGPRSEILQDMHENEIRVDEPALENQINKEEQ